MLLKPSQVAGDEWRELCRNRNLHKELTHKLLGGPPQVNCAIVPLTTR